MLQSLNIQNYALIEKLEFCPTKGLTVITGETGAGKSIIMGALGLILGQRADTKAVRTGATKCIIEATFDISDYQLEGFFEENDLEYDATNTILRREILATGKSRAFVNDVPVQLNVLKSLGEHLIDIHSQHQNLLIGEDTFQREVVDALAKNQKEIEAYKALYKSLLELRKELKSLQEMAALGTQEADFARFQFNQLEEAKLQKDELEELEQEQEVLSHAEEIKGGLSEISEQLDGDNISIIQSLKSISHNAQKLSSIYPALGELAERLETDYIDLKDIAMEVSDHAEQVIFDPERLDQVETRLSLIYSLLKKHNKENIAQLIELRNALEDQLERIDNSDEAILELEAKLKKQTEAIEKSAAQLTSTRKKAAKELEKALVEKVAYLGIPNVQFEVGISPLKDFSPNGKDEINYLFSANKNQPLKAAGEVASGGEISRLMLSIKSLVAKAKTLPTIIFDEIDTGISGDIADRMGTVMEEMSHHLQVITITHLPQVAGKGDAHFKVYKEDSNTETTTHINQLSEEERIKEIARMLSGSQITEQAIANAKTLIK